MGYGYWVFADRADDRLVGMGGLAYFCRGIAELEGFPEAGWAFDADHWGAGLATEAMGAALGWADAHLDAAEVRCIIDPGHEMRVGPAEPPRRRSDEHTSELQSLMRISYAVFCLKKKTTK